MIKGDHKCVMVYGEWAVFSGDHGWVALCSRSPPALKWRSWRAPWTSLRCAAAMETPTPTSAPCVSRDSEYTQLLHPHSIHTGGHMKSTLWRLKSPSRPPVVKQQSVNNSWFKMTGRFPVQSIIYVLVWKWAADHSSLLENADHVSGEQIREKHQISWDLAASCTSLFKS